MPIHQYTNFFGTQTPFYGACAGMGLLLIGIWMLHTFKVFNIDGDGQNEILFRFPFMVLFGLLFAFVLDAVFTGDWRTWTGPMNDRRFGFTFTGWLLGTVLFLLTFGGNTSFGRLFLCNTLLPSFALAQAVGRVGCFLGGCCYGIPCEWGVHYPEGSLPYSILGDVSLLPIQLCEAGALSLLFLICAFASFKFRAAIYLFGVSLIRFIAEFFRYDHRGMIYGIETFSPQQFMSMLFMVFGVGFLVAALRNRSVHGVISKK